MDWQMQSPEFFPMAVCDVKPFSENQFTLFLAQTLLLWNLVTSKELGEFFKSKNSKSQLNPMLQSEFEISSHEPLGDIEN